MVGYKDHCYCRVRVDPGKFASTLIGSCHHMFAMEWIIEGSDKHEKIPHEIDHVGYILKTSFSNLGSFAKKG